MLPPERMDLAAVVLDFDLEVGLSNSNRSLMTPFRGGTGSSLVPRKE